MSNKVLRFALLSATISFASGKVTVSGRQLLVDGSALHLKAVCWNPVPAGGNHPADLDFAGTVVADSALMASAGINAVRTYEPITSTAVLDALWAHKIYVLMSVYNWGGADPATVTSKINAVKGHPALLLWQVGNEWNYNKLYMNSMTIEQSIARIREVAMLIKELDTDHPVATVYGEVPTSELISSMPEIDVWGINAYRGISLGDLFSTWAARSTLPMYIGEYGADSYNANTGTEDQASQAAATTALTVEIVTNSVLKENGVCLGGAIFEFNDEWWKDTSGTLNAQDVGGIAPGGGPYPDSTFNEEWWGLVKMDRSLKSAFTAFKNVAMPVNGAGGDKGTAIGNTTAATANATAGTATGGSTSGTAVGTTTGQAPTTGKALVSMAGGMHIGQGSSILPVSLFVGLLLGLDGLEIQ